MDRNKKRGCESPDAAADDDDDHNKKARSSVELRVLDLPPFVSAGAFFEVRVMCTGEEGTLSAEAVSLGAPQLVFADSGLPAPDGLFDVESLTATLTGGRGSFRARINGLSRDQDGRAFKIVVPATLQCDGSTLMATTSPLSAIKLTATFDDDGKDGPVKFYNQSGGKSNYLCLHVDVTGATDAPPPPCP